MISKRNVLLQEMMEHYAATTDGHIYRTDEPVGRYPKRCRVNEYNYGGRTSVSLCVGRKKLTIQVYRFVIAYYRGVSDLHVDHIDGDSMNNHLSNLEYVTHQENMRRHWDLVRQGKISRRDGKGRVDQG